MWLLPRMSSVRLYQASLPSSETHLRAASIRCDSQKPLILLHVPTISDLSVIIQLELCWIPEHKTLLNLQGFFCRAFFFPPFFPLNNSIAPDCMSMSQYFMYLPKMIHDLSMSPRFPLQAILLSTFTSVDVEMSEEPLNLNWSWLVQISVNLRVSFSDKLVLQSNLFSEVRKFQYIPSL